MSWFKIRLRDPLKTWRLYGKRYFKFPKIIFSYYEIADSFKRYEDYFMYAKIIDIASYDVQWKTTFRDINFEEDPTIRVILLRRWVFSMKFVPPTNDTKLVRINYWESIIQIMRDKYEHKDDYDEKISLLNAYKHNIWSDRQGGYTDTIETYLNNKGWHLLKSLLTSSDDKIIH